ncbi:MAG: hypothetical protein ACX94C_01650 [Phycisphaerales bacterium]
MRGLMIGLVAGVMGLGALCLGGCRAVHVTKVNPDKYKHGDRVPGVVYYAPEPYLRVVVAPKLDKDKKLLGYETKTEVLYLPNPHKAYAINSDASGGENKLDVTLNNGWMLTKLNGTTDPQVDEGLTSLAALVTSVTGFLKDNESIASGETVENPEELIKVYLMHIDIGPNGCVTLGPMREYPPVAKAGCCACKKLKKSCKCRVRCCD